MAKHPGGIGHYTREPHTDAPTPIGRMGQGHSQTDPRETDNLALPASEREEVPIRGFDPPVKERRERRKKKERR